ncbi:MAG: universal stress protein [Bacteroidota bacterium]
MLTINKILFPTDFSACAERAFSHAAELAVLFEAEIHTFHARVRQQEDYPALQHLLDLPEDTIPKSPHVHPPEHTTATPNLVIKADATAKSACDAILSYTESREIDLIVMGSHGRRGPRRLFLGSTAECVIRNASCPVITLRDGAKTMKNGKINRILVPVDFSDFSREALAHAVALATLTGASITLIHVIEEAFLPTVYGVDPVNFISDPLKKKYDKALTELGASMVPAGINVHVKTQVGHAAESITAFAETEGIDLIILASHGLTGLKRFFLGSTAASLNRQAPCAVLTVKSFGKKLVKTSAASNTRTNEAEPA